MRNRARQQIEREIARAERTRRMRNDKKFHAEGVMRQYEKAYEAAYSARPPHIDYKGGWYVIYHSAFSVKRYREADILKKTKVMWGTAYAREIEDATNDL